MRLLFKTLLVFFVISSILVGAPRGTYAGQTYPVVVSVSNASPLPIPTSLWGINLQGFLGSPMESYSSFLNYLRPNGAAAARALGVRLVRFPGGSAANAYVWNNGTGSYLDLGGANQVPFMTITEGLTMAADMGAEMLYQANLNSASVQGPDCKELADIVSFPAHFNSASGRSFIRYVELGHDQPLSMPPTTYRQIAIRCAQVIKNIDPTIQIGLISYGSLDESPGHVTQRAVWNQMLSTLLPNRTCGPTGNIKCYDFVTDRIAPRALHTGYTPPFLGQAQVYVSTNMGTNPNAIDPANPRNPIYLGENINPGTPLGFTEWNVGCVNNVSRQTPIPAAGTVEQGMFTGLSLFTFVEEGLTVGAFNNLTIDGTFPPETGCGLFRLNAGNVELSAAGQAFELTSIAAGGTLLNTGVGIHQSLLQVNENITCTARDCLDIGAGGLTGISNLKAYAVQQGNDMYIFLFNRDFDTTNLFDVTINYNPYVNFNPTVTITGTILTGVDYRNRRFVANPVTVTNPTPGQINFPVPGVSIARIRIADFFTNAPQPTPTPLISPNLNLTEVIRLINSKRPPVKVCTPEILPYIFAVVIYIMTIHFAIAMKQEFKMTMHVTFFVIGFAVGYYLCNMTAGFMAAVFMSLFLW